MGIIHIKAIRIAFQDIAKNGSYAAAGVIGRGAKANV
jgi:hypothetical protein